MSGAASCVAADIDELALVAARCNARTAGVELATTGRDLLAGAPTGWNVILVGDVTYEAALAVQVERFLITARKAGALVLFGDRTTSASRLALGSGVAEYPASVYPVLEDGCDESARVWQIEADG